MDQINEEAICALNRGNETGI